jgi:transposase
MEALLLKSQGLPHHQITEIVGICENTLLEYFREYQQGGISALLRVNFYTPTSPLRLHSQTLESYFHQHPPATINEAIAKIKALTGIQRSPTQVRQFLRSIGMKRRKVGSIPSKADAHQQEVFKNQQLLPRLQEAEKGKRIVYFVDAVHFVFAPFLGFLWCFKRVFVKAPCGRKRYNVLAALDAITHQLISVSNQTYINATSVCQLMRQIAQQSSFVPITLILDNAKYQKCPIVRQLAVSLDIELLYLPSYSPNLNLIERVWKFVKKHCLYSRYYPDFSSFQRALADFIENVHQCYAQELDSLLSFRFQTFDQDDSQPLALAA